MNKILIKIKNWEFWPIWIVYFPIFFAWLWYSFKLKSLFFFTTVNPKIEMGGFAGESKMGIFNQIPKKYLPKTIFISKNQNFNDVQKIFKEKGIIFPCVAKPDVGERGLAVQVCKTINDIEKYMFKVKADFIIQDFIDYPMELAILYYRFPNKKTGKISSVCEKKFLSVVGNGRDSILDLMKKDERAFLYIDKFKKEQKELLKVILKADEHKILEPIGNHSRGTIFLDKNKYIDKELINAFDKLSHQIPELHFGRYDLKCKSIEDLKQLKNFAILEINGVSAEPAHIYQPGYSFLKAEKVLLKQWKVLYEISSFQISKGIKPMTFLSALKHIKSYRKKIILHLHQKK